MSKIFVEELKALFLRGQPLIDVRAPIEFQWGALPGAINLPLMNDEERAAVGTAYKKSGREEAIRLGHALVAGGVRQERIQAWLDYIQKNPTAILYCFRGGLRSQTTQKWLSEQGIVIPLIDGGYKEARQFLMKQLDLDKEKSDLLILSGPTGSAKTHLLEKIKNTHRMIDLEKLAEHRGSAFGGVTGRQPSQVDFENRLALEILKLQETSLQTPIFIEDESRLIGRCAVPESLFNKMRESALVYIDEPLSNRVENIFQDYILRTPLGAGDVNQGLAVYSRYSEALNQISKKLGGLRTQEISRDMKLSENKFIHDVGDLESNRIWIEKLLVYYYDPFYLKSFERRAPRVLFRGSRLEVEEFIAQIK